MKARLLHDYPAHKYLPRRTTDTADTHVHKRVL